MKRGERHNARIERGDIVYANLDPFRGSEQGGFRPVLIIQNQLGNIYSRTVVCIPLSTRKEDLNRAYHFSLENVDCGTVSGSIVLCEQIRALDKSRLYRKITRIEKSVMAEIEKVLLNALGITSKGHESHE